MAGSQQFLGYLWINRVSRFWRLQEVVWHLLRQLAHLSPLPDSVEVPTLMPGIEIDKCCWCRLVIPHLAEYSNVHRTHELLSEDIKTVG